MKFTGQFKYPRIGAAARKKLHEHMNDVIVRAATIWLNAVLAKIPVWRGDSHRTFMQLAAAAHYQLTIAPKSGTKASMSGGGGTGSIESKPGSGTYVFKYANNLWHLGWNEYHDGNATKPQSRVYYRLITPGPYNFQQAGFEAYRQFAETVRLPNPFKHLTVKTIRIK